MGAAPSRYASVQRMSVRPALPRSSPALSVASPIFTLRPRAQTGSRQSGFLPWRPGSLPSRRRMDRPQFADGVLRRPCGEKIV